MLTLSSCQKNHQRRDPTDECNSNELGNIRAHAQKNEFFMKNTRHSIFIYFLTYNIYFINSFSHFSHETQKFTLRSLIHTYVRTTPTTLFQKKILQLNITAEQVFPQHGEQHSLTALLVEKFYLPRLRTHNSPGSA